MNQILRLTRNCLSFDFIGTSTDESIDDMSTVQIPTNWRPAFLNLDTLKLFFDLYHILPSRLSSLALSTLVQVSTHRNAEDPLADWIRTRWLFRSYFSFQIISVRRSLFSNSERAKFLSHLLNGIKNILENSQGLSDPDNYHEFCRLLARLKTNYQLGELVTVESYPETIQLIAKFTVQSLQVSWVVGCVWIALVSCPLQMWQFAPNSVHYLLSLWQRMVASVPYVKATEPHLLSTYTPEVTKAYITSRLDSMRIIVRCVFGYECEAWTAHFY